MIELNHDCYSFEEIHFSKGFLDDSVDATYIIHLEGNGRLDDIYKQLEQFYPTKVVYIMINKGFSKCNKNLHENIPPIDLVDAFLQTFKHAHNHKYENVLVLEDDFIFNKKINNPKVSSIINKFINKKRGQSFIYMLGCLPYNQIPYDYNHNMVLQSAGTHACIYSKLLVDQFLKTNQTAILDWDIYTHINCFRYTYFEPLCYQLFPQTENQKYWGVHFKSSFVDYITNLFKQLFKFLNLDKTVEPGYTIMYSFSKIVSFILLIMFFILLKYLVGVSNFIRKKFITRIKGKKL